MVLSQLNYCNGKVHPSICKLFNSYLQFEQIAEILKDRPSWFRDCRKLEVFTMFPAGNGGMIELVYMQVRTLKVPLILHVEVLFFNWKSYKSSPTLMVIAADDQMYAPTTIAPARDFWTLRYTTTLEDGSLVVCPFQTIQELKSCFPSD